MLGGDIRPRRSGAATPSRDGLQCIDRCRIKVARMRRRLLAEVRGPELSLRQASRRTGDPLAVGSMPKPRPGLDHGAASPRGTTGHTR